MLVDPPPREPPENPPPPPRALAKETAGTPMSAQTMQEAISFLVITSDCPFGSALERASVLPHPNRYRRKKPKIRGASDSRRAGQFQGNSSDASHAENKRVCLRAQARSAITPHPNRRLVTASIAMKGSGMSYTSLNIDLADLTAVKITCAQCRASAEFPATRLQGDAPERCFHCRAEWFAPKSPQATALEH